MPHHRFAVGLSLGADFAGQRRGRMLCRTFHQELDGSWTLRFGPLPAAQVAQALAAFGY
jgi:hypothetical protein